MNEREQAAAAAVEEAFAELDLTQGASDWIESLWLSGDKASASRELRDASKGKLTLAKARGLLRRAYGDL